MEHVNTLKAYKDLMAAGVSETQAEAQVNLLNNSLDHLATKDDLKNLEKDLVREMAHLRHTMYAIGTICALPILKEILKLVPYFSNL